MAESNNMQVRGRGVTEEMHVRGRGLADDMQDAAILEHVLGLSSSPWYTTGPMAQPQGAVSEMEGAPKRSRAGPAASTRLRPSQSEYQRRYRERNKQRVSDLEHQVALLTQRLRELEESADGKASRKKEEEKPLKKPVEELEAMAAAAVDDFRSALWNETDGQLMVRLKNFITLCNKLKIMHSTDVVVCGRASLVGRGQETPELGTHWASVVSRSELDEGKKQAIVEWRDRIVEEAQRRHETRKAEMETVRQLSYIVPDPRSVNGLFGGDYNLHRAVGSLCRSMKDQNDWLNSELNNLVEEIGVRPTVRLVLLSWPVMVDTFALANAIKAQMSSGS
mmetsp:Transcript_6723/g.23776  ORF Transcript_6723/g.23776 Transcript_6723/m.23776 type:complete len:336 (-) Transcript_6723:156-1163(-)